MPAIQPAITQISPNMRGSVQLTPSKVILAADGAVSLFDKNTEADRNLHYMRIQNVGVGKLKVCIDGNDVTAEEYNFLLKVDTGAEAGGGGACEIFGAWDVKKVSVMAVADTKICLTKVTTTRTAAVYNY